MTTKTGSGEIYLTKLSPKDQKFDDHKGASVKVAKLFGLDGNKGLKGFISGSRVIEFVRYESRISECGTWLKFWQTTDDFKLINARFCKVPYCPMCQFRRSLKWRAKFLGALPNIQAQYPTHKWIFLTLTVKNCQIQNLRETIKGMNTAWARLSKLVNFPLDGAIKSLEITRIWDWYDGDHNFLGRHGVTWWYRQKDADKHLWIAEPTDEVHPHFHILGMVQASYFTGRGYIKQEQWSEMWRQSLRIDYDPIVHIERVKSKKGKNIIPTLEEIGEKEIQNFDDGMIKGLCETLKYTVKEQDLLGTFCKDEDINSDWLKELTEQLYLLRRVEYRGVLKEFGKEVEKSLENLIDIEEEKEKEVPEEGKEITAFWSRKLKRYLISVKDDLKTCDK